MSSPASRYMAFEQKLIQRFAAHPLFGRLPSMTLEDLIPVLLQVGHLSAEFVKWYERAKLGFSIEGAREVIRTILRDEIPANKPTHQDDRLADLERLGVPKELILNAPATPKTQQALRTMYDLVRYPQDHYDLRVLVTLRVAGEVLVGETYRHICLLALDRLGLPEESSRFYWPHFRHDVLEEGQTEGHSNAFDLLLATLITDEAEQQIAEEAAEAAFNLRYQILGQFT